MMTDLAYHRRVERSRKLVIFCTLMAPIYMTSFVMRRSHKNDRPRLFHRRQDHVFSIDLRTPSPRHLVPALSTKIVQRSHLKARTSFLYPFAMCLLDF